MGSFDGLFTNTAVKQKTGKDRFSGLFGKPAAPKVQEPVMIRGNPLIEPVVPVRTGPGTGVTPKGIDVSSHVFNPLNPTGKIYQDKLLEGVGETTTAGQLWGGTGRKTNEFISGYKPAEIDPNLNAALIKKATKVTPEIERDPQVFLDKAKLDQDSLLNTDKQLVQKQQQLQDLHDLVQDPDVLPEYKKNAINEYNKLAPEYNKNLEVYKQQSIDYNAKVKALQAYNAKQNLQGLRDTELQITPSALEVGGKFNEGLLQTAANNLILPRAIQAIGYNQQQTEYANKVEEEFTRDHPVIATLDKGIAMLADTILLTKAGAGFGLKEKLGAPGGVLSDTLKFVNPKYGQLLTQILAEGAQGGLIFGIQSFLNEGLKQAQERNFEPGKLAGRTGTGTLFGFFTGGAGPFDTRGMRFLFSGGGVASLITAEKLIEDKNISGQDLLDIGVNSLVAGMFSALSGPGKGVQKAQRMAELNNEYQITQLMGRNPKLTRTEAEQLSNFINKMTYLRVSGQTLTPEQQQQVIAEFSVGGKTIKNWNNIAQGNTQLMQILKEVPASFSGLPAPEQHKIVLDVTKQVKAGVPLEQAVQTATSYLLGAKVSTQANVKGFPTANPLKEQVATQLPVNEIKLNEKGIPTANPMIQEAPQTPKTAPEKAITPKAKVSPTVNAEEVSKATTNSLLNNPENALKKPNRLQDEGYSFQEAQTGLTATGKDLPGRIVIGRNDAGEIILKDGTHLLEAYRQKEIPIPDRKIKLEDGLTIQDLQKPIMPIETPKVETPKPTKLTSRVFTRLQEENKVLEGTVKYEVKNQLQQAEAAVDLIAKNKNKAFQIAMGAEESPDVTQTAVNIALSERALEEGNNSLYARLVKNRSLAQTRRGQEIVAEKGSITDNSTSKYVKELLDTRLRQMGNNYLTDLKARITKVTPKKRAMEAIDKEVAKAEKILKNKELDLKEAQALIDSLACK